MTPAIILIIIVLLVGLLAISAYNRLVRLRNTRENAFADIDVNSSKFLSKWAT